MPTCFPFPIYWYIAFFWPYSHFLHFHYNGSFWTLSVYLLYMSSSRGLFSLPVIMPNRNFSNTCQGSKAPWSPWLFSQMLIVNSKWLKLMFSLLKREMNLNTCSQRTSVARFWVLICKVTLCLSEWDICIKKLHSRAGVWLYLCFHIYSLF